LTTPLKVFRTYAGQDTTAKVCQEVFPYLSPELRNLITGLPEKILKNLEEVRLRILSPILLRAHHGDFYLSSQGKPVPHSRDGLSCTPQFLEKTVVLLCNSSLYALEEELQKGYLTLPGGHRAGFVGRAVLEAGKIKTLKYISSVNIRIARAVSGCSAPVLKYLIDRRSFRNTLIISPPRGGKTTILRDIIKALSEGFETFSPVDVGLVDERSEIAGCREGVPQLPVGPRTDVLDGCPKAEGMMMLVRAMAPHVIATDEIGRNEDADAIQEVINAGIKLLATVHGGNMEEITRRPVIREIIEQRVFERYLILSRKKGPGTVEAILNRDFQPIIGKDDC